MQNWGAEWSDLKDSFGLLSSLFSHSFIQKSTWETSVISLNLLHNLCAVVRGYKDTICMYIILSFTLVASFSLSVVVFKPDINNTGFNSILFH